MQFPKILSVLLLSSSLAFIGCKKKTDTAAPPAESAAKPADPATPAAAPAAATPTPAAPAAGGAIASDDAYIAMGVEMMDKVIEIFKGAGTNCDKLADDLTKLASETDGKKKASQDYEKAHPDVKKKFDAATKDKTAGFEAAAGPALTACKDNKKVGDALTKLAGE